jgi:hypothetical protein
MRIAFLKQKPVQGSSLWCLYVVTIFVLACILSACQSDTRHIRDYYFPLKQLTEGLVYEYQSVNNDSLAPEYWYFRSFVLDSGIYLTGTSYSPDFTPQQLVREEMVSNGMILQDLYLYDSDSTDFQQQVAAQIIAGNVFPFEVRDSGGIFLYKVSWQLPSEPGATTTLIKNRRYAGDTTFVFQDKRYDCVVFEVRELLEYDLNGRFEQEFSSVEWYAKGLGLVYYRKDIAADLVLEYRLIDRYPMTRLEEAFRQKLQQ